MTLCFNIHNYATIVIREDRGCSLAKGLTVTKLVETESQYWTYIHQVARNTTQNEC